MTERARRERREELKGMSPAGLRAEAARCTDEAEKWKRHDREFGPDVSDDLRVEAEEYRTELRRRGEPLDSWKGERFCGHEVVFDDDDGEPLELA